MFCTIFLFNVFVGLIHIFVQLGNRVDANKWSEFVQRSVLTLLYAILA